MQTSDNKKDINNRTHDLIQSVINVFSGAIWIVNSQADVLVRNGVAETLFETSSGLPILIGRPIPIDLREMVLSAQSDRKRIDFPGLQIENPKIQKEKPWNLSIVPIDEKLTMKRKKNWFLVHLFEQDYPTELTVQKVQNEKLNSLTGMAAKIAHELNNPLDGSMRYINLALRKVRDGALKTDEPEKMEEYLSSAREALGKMNDILSDLTKFAKNGQSNISSISVSDLIDQAVRTLTARATAKNVTIVTVLNEELPEVGNPRLYQVFCNLLKNAIDAILDRRKKESDAPALITIRTLQSNSKVHVIFEDTGCGLPADSDQLFQPFFTTKTIGEGTGLGLAISKEIVGSLGGIIRAENLPAGGARFTIELEGNLVL
jgi:signal transduction histidine kinase